MRRNYLGFALLSEGRLETIDALFELEQLSGSTCWEDGFVTGARSTGPDKQIDGLFVSIFDVIKSCLRLRKSQTDNSRG